MRLKQPPSDVEMLVGANLATTAKQEPSLYDTDEHGWYAQQAMLLRENSLNGLDRMHLAEFLDDMATRDRHELRSRLGVLLLHLLKLQFQPERVTASWLNTIDREQVEIKERLESATLRNLAPGLYERAWAIAVRGAARETGLPLRDLPASNPWSMQDALDFPLPANTAAPAVHKPKKRSSGPPKARMDET